MTDLIQAAVAGFDSLAISKPNPADSIRVTTTDTLATQIPPHRSHDPSSSLKRSDPFKFGSRYLQENDDVYEFNAWDHVIPDQEYYSYAESQYANQRASPVTDFDKQRFNCEPAKWWNKFYSNNSANFFKNRKWLQQEFPILSKLTSADARPVSFLEVGAGAGNTAFPVLKANQNPGLMIHACDFSSKAVELIKSNEAYDPKHIQASVWDIASDELPLDVCEQSVDVVILVFIFSALSPEQWAAAVRNVYRALKPGGEVCFRDYGRGDLTQVRLRKGRYMQESFYIRGDGTRVYFFEEEELRRIWRGGHVQNGQTSHAQRAMPKDGPVASEQPRSPTSELDHNREFSDTPAFEIVSLGVDRRMLVNRQKKLKMYRCWMQGHFRKPVELSLSSSSTNPMATEAEAETS